MGGPRVIALVALAVLFSTACGERQSDAPTAPDVAKTGTTAAVVSCNLNTVTQLAKSEFGASSPQAGLATDMKQAGSQTDDGTFDGYQILVAIAGKYETTAPTTTTPSQLAAALLPCMKLGSPQPALPTATGLAKNLALTGAFEVRALGTNPDNEPVVSHDGAWVLEPPLSGDPPTNQSWQSLLPADGFGVSADTRIKTAFLALGSPVDSSGFTLDSAKSLAFEWATLPAPAFTSDFVVGQCLADPNYLQHLATGEDGVEVLGFVNPRCDLLVSTAEAPPSNFAERLFRTVRPAPLSASMLFTTGSGGSKRTVSPFIVIAPGSVVLDALFKWSKSTNTVNVPFSPTPTYQITSRKGTDFEQEKVLMWLTASGNKGTNVDVCNNYAYTGTHGIAAFTNSFINKAGGYTITTRSAGAVNLSNGTLNVTLPTVPPSTPVNSPLVNVKSGVGTVACDPAGAFNPIFSADGVLQNPPPFPGPNPAPPQ
jgi:hypothetical protein